MSRDTLTVREVEHARVHGVTSEKPDSLADGAFLLFTMEPRGEVGPQEALINTLDANTTINRQEKTASRGSRRDVSVSSRGRGLTQVNQTCKFKM